jgi:hypothetical protein
VRNCIIRNLAAYTLSAKKRNTDVTSDLNVSNLTERIERRKENWHENILGITADRLPKILLTYKPEDTELSDDPQPDRRMYSLEIGNRPMALCRCSADIRGKIFLHV